MDIIIHKLQKALDDLRAERAELVDKVQELQMENEELELNYNVLEKAYITDNIPKQVIKDKIEELERELKNEQEMCKAFNTYSYGVNLYDEEIKLLKVLLKENGGN